MALYTALLLTIFWNLCNSGCVPANTCFTIQGGNTLSMFDKSYEMICEPGTNNVIKRTYSKSTDCSSTGSSVADAIVTAINDGDQVVGSGSGSITTEYLQGTNCPTLTGASETCSDYMVLRHRGNIAHQTGAYLDIGDNCTNYVGNENTFTRYSEVVIPTGCVNYFSTGSAMMYCDAEKWGYMFYDGRDCTGTVLSAQTDEFQVDKCGYFSERTHCGNQGGSGSSKCTPSPLDGTYEEDGVHQYWWYWYDLVCCPGVTGSCSGDPSSSTPSPVNSGSNSTPSPVNSGSNSTPSPVNSGSNSTPSPVSNNTPNPASSGSTPSPSDTPYPTNPGTAQPTAPTTKAPTSQAGTAQPTAPTTKAPTSQGKPGSTRAPTMPTLVGGTAEPTASTGVVLWSVIGMIFGGIVTLSM